MARCYMTGVEFPLAEGFVLDPAAANRALRNFRKKIEEIQRLIDQLGQCDAVEIPNKLKRNVSRRYRRIVCQSVAEVLTAACPEGNLFLAWPEYRRRLPAPRSQGLAKGANDDGGA